MSFYVKNQDDHEEAKSFEKVHYQDGKKLLHCVFFENDNVLETISQFMYLYCETLVIHSVIGFIVYSVG